MGSMLDRIETTRALAVLAEARPDLVEFPLPDLRRMVGRSLTVSAVNLRAEGTDRIIAEAFLVADDGEVFLVDLGIDLPITRTGLCGYDLQRHIDAPVLREMVECAIENGANGLDLMDRDVLRRELATELV